MWSGFFHISALIESLSYPSVAAFIASVFLMGAFPRYLKSGGFLRLAIIGVGTGCVLLTHPSTAQFLIIVLAAQTFERLTLDRFSPSERDILIGLRAIAPMLLAAIVVVTWPYFPFLGVVSGWDATFDAHSKALYSDILGDWRFLLVSAVIVPPAIYAMLHRLRVNIRDAAVVSLFALFCVYVLGGVADRPGLGRVVSYIHLLGAIFAVEGMVLFYKKRRKVSIVVLWGMVAVSVGFYLNWGHQRLFFKFYHAAQGDLLIPSRINFLRTYLDDEDVVLANPQQSLEIMPIANIVYVDRPLHLISDQAERKETYSLIMYDDASYAQICSAIDDFKITKLITDSNSQIRDLKIGRQIALVHSENGLNLYNVASCAS